MSDVLDVILAGALSMGLTYLVVACDRLRLTPEQRARGWNTASTGSAIVGFSPVCLIAHFWVTRRSVMGLLQGVFWTVAVSVLYVGLATISDQLGVWWLCAVIILAPSSPVVLLLTLVAILF